MLEFLSFENVPYPLQLGLIGMISGLLILILPLFTQFELPFRNDKWYLKVLYVVMAFIIGMISSWLNELDGFDKLSVVALCAFWPKILEGIAATLSTVNKARESQNNEIT